MMSLARTLIAAPSPLPLVARLLLARLRGIQHGSLHLLTPEGTSLWFGQAGTAPHAELRILDWAACKRLLLAGDIGFAESLRDGLLDSPDLSALMRLALQNEAALGRAFTGSLPARCWYMVKHVLRYNSRAGSQRNIHAHYDLGNDFYRLWLDTTWTYSSALFKGAKDLSLADAQAAKYQRICDVLALKPGMRVLELGCGWGGFAEHATRQGVQVHGITISRAQLDAAVERLQGEALATFELKDYRDITGQYDAIVSIEMFEAVGESYWPTYFHQVRSLLKAGGQALIQTITIADHRFASYRRSSDFIQEFIFPGGMLPSPSVFEQEARKAGLRMHDRLDFGADYAETLRRWRSAFELSLDAVRDQGFDDAFIRLWRLYLCYCEAGFDEGSIGVSQFLLQAGAS